MSIIQSIIGTAVNSVISPNLTVDASILNAHPDITTGIYRRDYDMGYFADDVNWFTGKTPSLTQTDNYVNIGDSLNNPIDYNEYSIQWTGYFIAPVDGAYTFETTSDDASYMWLGAAAVSGYTTANAIVKNGGPHGDTAVNSLPVLLKAGKAYPVRFQFGEGGGGATMYARYTLDNGNTWIYFLDGSNNSQFKYITAYPEGFLPLTNSFPVLSLDASTYTSNSTWTDIVSNKDFVLYGNPTWSDTNGGQIRFDPAGPQYGDCATSLPQLDSFTVQGVFKLHSLPVSALPQLITEIYFGQPKLNYSLGFVNDQTNIAFGFFDVSVGFWNTKNAVAASTDTWYDVVGTYDASTKQMKVYLNGTLAASGTVAGTPGSTGSGIRIAGRWDNSEYLDSTIKAINIWNGVLTPAEITAQHTPYNSLT